MSEISQPEIIAKSEMVEGPKSSEVTEEFLRLTPEGRAKINYIDGLLNRFIETPDTRLKENIVKHLENIEKSEVDEYQQLSITQLPKEVNPITICKSDISETSEIFLHSDDKWEKPKSTLLNLNSMDKREINFLKYSSNIFKYINPDTVLINGQNGNVSIVDLNSGESIENNDLNEKRKSGIWNIPSIIDNTDGTIIMPGQNQSLLFIDSKDLSVKDTIENCHTDFIASMLLTEKGELITGGFDKKIKFWDLKTKKLIKKISNDFYYYIRGDGDHHGSHQNDTISGTMCMIKPNVLAAAGTGRRIDLYDSDKKENVGKIDLPLSFHVKSISRISDDFIVLRTTFSFQIVDLKTNQVSPINHQEMVDTGNVFVLPNNQLAFIYQDDKKENFLSIWGDPNIDYKKYYDLAFPKEKK